MNRELLKRAIRKIVLQEITNSQFGTPIQTDNKDSKGEEALRDALGKSTEIEHAIGTGKTAGKSEKQSVQLSKNADDYYDVVSVTNESERKIARGVSLEDAVDLVKKHAKDCSRTYVQKAYDKSLKGFGKEGVKETKSDLPIETSQETQKDISDDSTNKAQIVADKENAPINDDISGQMGGNLVDKIEKIIDRVLKDKNKSEPKTAYLTADKEVKSPNKLSVDLKSTPPLK